ncbi:MAG: 5'-nucleotidase C-terminal domain-containing protein [Elusimicrobiales bacterium]|nr:5'-nucleotidase C-terminal domain-containing protein [Elusimicrobiales bacterium]
MKVPALKYALPALLLLAGACSKKEQVVIFATGRGQGRLWAREEASLKGARAGGYAVFKKLLDAETAPKLALDTGNWFSATPEGWLTRGRSTIDCLGAAGYGAAAAGMEDLSLSPAELQKLATASAVPLLASNLYLKTNKKPDYLRSQVVLQAGRRKVGVFSAMIASPAKPNRAKYLLNYKLEKESYETERAVKALKDSGAELIVLLLGINPREKASPEFFREFLSKGPRIDLVITDEPSLKKPFKAGRTWVAPAGLEGLYASRLALELDPATGRLKDLDWTSLPLLQEKYGQDQAVLKVITGHRKYAAAHFSRRVGSLEVPLPLADKGDTPAADFTADCMQRWARTNAAILGLKEPAVGFSSGPVTIGHLYASFPLDSNVVFVKIRGDDLERALAAIPPGEISVAGLQLFYKDGLLERVATPHGPLAPAHVYRLAVPDSFVGGKDNPILSSAMEFANSRRYLREITGWCFSRQRSYGRPQGGRIVRN